MNLQAPFVQTRLGFDTTDYALDVVISPDRREWRRRDQDELQRLVTADQFTRGQADELYGEGRRVIYAARLGQPASASATRRTTGAGIGPVVANRHGEWKRP